MIIDLVIKFRTKEPLVEEQAKPLRMMALYFSEVQPCLYAYQALEPGTDLEGIQNEVLAYIKSKAGDDIEIVEMRSARNERAESLGKKIG